MLLDHDAFRKLCAARDLLAHGSGDLPHVAHEIGMSQFHFIRRFHALFGCTPHQFRIDLRMERAKQLLASRQLSVTETCMEVGMSSLGTFSDHFLRRVGETPSAYQRRARTMVRVPGTIPQDMIPGCLSLMASLPPGAFL